MCREMLHNLVEGIHGLATSGLTEVGLSSVGNFIEQVCQVASLTARSINTPDKLQNAMPVIICVTVTRRYPQGWV